VLAECASGFALMSFLRGCAARGGGFATRTPFGGSAPGTPGGGCAPCSPWGFPPVDGCRLRGQRPEGRGELRGRPTIRPHPATNRKRQHLPLRPRGDRDGVGTRSLRDVQTSARRA
jgi:hypothetical protein